MLLNRYITVEHKHLTWAECFMAAQSSYYVGPYDAGGLEDKDVTKVRVRSSGGPKVQGDGSAHAVDIVINPEDVGMSSTSSKREVDAKLRRLPLSLRCIYVDLITRLFVDVGENRDVLSERELTFDLDSIKTTYFSEASADQTKALSGATFGNFPEVKRWIKKILDATTAMIHNDQFQGKPRNIFLQSVLTLLYTLICFGYYADPNDISTLIEPLKGVIDGRNDFDESEDKFKNLKSNKKDVGSSSRGGKSLRAKQRQLDASGGEGDRTAEDVELWRAGERYKIDSNAQQVVKAKQQALCCAEALLNFAFNVRLRYLLVDFKLVELHFLQNQKERKRHFDELEKVSKDHNKRFKISDFKRYGQIKPRLDFLHMLTKTEEGKVLQEVDGGKQGLLELTKQGRGYLTDLWEQSDWVTPKWNVDVQVKDTDESLAAVLVDLSRYRDYSTMFKALQVLDMLYSSQSSLTSLAVQAKILITDRSKELAKVLRGCLPELKRLCAGSIGKESAMAFCKIVTYMTSMCYIGGEHSTLDAIKFQGRAYDDNRAWEEPGMPHRTNQEILFNNELVPLLMGVLRNTAQLPPVLRCSFWLLRGLCVNFEGVQMALYESLDSILATKTTAPPDYVDEKKYEAWQNSMGWVLTAIFDGCRDTCLRVTAPQVQSLLQRVGEGDKFQTFKANRILVALRAVAKVEDWNLPLKRNQEMIIKFMWEKRTEVVDITEIDSESNAETNKRRLQLLCASDLASSKQDGEESEFGFGADGFDSDDSDDDGGGYTESQNVSMVIQQRYHVNLVYLFASCCEGENSQIESMCRSIFSLDELIQTIQHPDILPLNKSPYISFLLWSYLNTAASAIEVGTDSLRARPDIFAAFEVVTRTELSTYLSKKGTDKSINEIQAEFVWDVLIPCLDKLVTFHFPSDEPSRKCLYKIASHLVYFVKNAMNTNTRAHENKFRLLGAVSAFEAFEKKLWPDSGGAENDRESAESVFSKVPWYDPKSDKEYTMTSATKAEAAFHNAYLALGKAQQTAHAGVNVSSAASKYQKYYAEEIEMNSRFNSLVSSLGEVYASTNTVESQLNFPEHPPCKVIEQYDAEYCDLEEGPLPLGPEFQHLVMLFVTYDKTPPEIKFKPGALDVFVRLWDEHLSGAAELSAKDRQLMSHTMARALQITRAAIRNLEVVDAPQKSMYDAQDQIIEADGVLPIASLMASTNLEVRRECLATLDAVIAGGNRRAQLQFTRYFLYTREEHFFDNVQNLLNLSVESISELRVLRGQKADSDRRISKLRGSMRGSLRDSVAVRSPNGGHSKGGGSNLSVSQLAKTAEDVVMVESEEPVEVKDKGNLVVLMSVLSNLCEGTNTSIQDYLRDQPDNIKTVNVIELSCNALGVIAQETDATTYPLLTQLLATLAEFVQGNQQNGKLIFDLQVVDHINRILQELELDLRKVDSQSSKASSNAADSARLSRDQAALLAVGVATLLDRLLALNDPSTAYIAQEMDSMLDIALCLRFMRHYFAAVGEVMFDPDNGDDPVSSQIIGVMFYNVIARLDDFNKKQYAADQALSRIDEVWRNERGFSDLKPLDKSLDEIKSRMQVVELLVNNVVQKVHFDVDPRWIKQLQEESKEHVLWGVDRSSIANQHRDFITMCRTIIADMKTSESVRNSGWMVRILMDHSKLWSRVMLALTFLINALMIASWVAPTNTDDAIPEYQWDWVEITFTVLGSLHLVSTLFVVVSHFLRNPPEFPWEKRGDSAAALNFAKAGAESESFDVIRYLKNNAIVPPECVTFNSIIGAESLYFFTLLSSSALGIAYYG